MSESNNTGLPTTLDGQQDLADHIVDEINNQGLEFGGRFEDVTLVLRLAAKKLTGVDSWDELRTNRRGG